DLRQPHLMRLHNDRTGKNRRQRVADPRHEADDPIPAEPDAPARHATGFVEQALQRSQSLHPAPVVHASSEHVYQNHQRNTPAPTVQPARTEANTTRFPFFSLPAHIASLSASGSVAAVVLPNRSMLMMTFSGSMPSLSLADRMIRRFA